MPAATSSSARAKAAVLRPMLKGYRMSDIREYLGEALAAVS